MALYTIADLHLSLGVDKPMDTFGGVWAGYMDKLRAGLSCLRDTDTLVIPGDISWGINLGEALPDFQFLAGLPGRKILLKGNHDLWWETAAKMERFFTAHALENIHFLHNNCHMYGDTALCGTRGWFYEEESGSAHDEKMMNREVGRLETSLKAAQKAGAARIYCFLHYPPIYGQYRCPRILEMLSDYGVECCFYGHLHDRSQRRAFEGVCGGVRYALAAADYLEFTPILILE